MATRTKLRAIFASGALENLIVHILETNFKAIELGECRSDPYEAQIWRQQISTLVEVCFIIIISYVYLYDVPKGCLYHTIIPRYSLLFTSNKFFTISKICQDTIWCSVLVAIKENIPRNDRCQNKTRMKFVCKSWRHHHEQPRSHTSPLHYRCYG